MRMLRGALLPRSATGTVDSALRLSLKRREQLLKVDRVSELHTEPQAVLIDVGLRRRGGSGALLKKRVLGEYGRIPGELIARRERHRERLDVDLGSLPAAHGRRDVVGGRERHDQASLPGRKREGSRDGLSISGAAEAPGDPYGSCVLEADRADLEHLDQPPGGGRAHGGFA